MSTLEESLKRIEAAITALEKDDSPLDSNNNSEAIAEIRGMISEAIRLLEDDNNG